MNCVKIITLHTSRSVGGGSPGKCYGALRGTAGVQEVLRSATWDWGCPGKCYVGLRVSR